MNVASMNSQNPSQDGKVKTSLFLLLAVFCLLHVLSPSVAIAQGVIANTEISNTVTVNYSINGLPQSPIESSPTGNSTPGAGNGTSTTFKVDRKIDLVVTGNSNANVSPGETQSQVTFTLKNEGNDTQEFGFTINHTLTSDNFDTTNCSSEVTSVTGTPIPGVIIPTTGNIKLKADQQAYITVKCDIPMISGSGTALQTGDASLVSLIATAEKNSDGSNVAETLIADKANVVDTVFSDSLGSDDNNRDATHSARRSYLITTTATPPSLLIDKTIIDIVDPSGGNTAVTNSEVTYKIKISTTGSGFIDNVIITDPTPANMTYKPASIKLNNIAQTDINDVVDNTTFDYLAPTPLATINLGSIVAGSQYEILLTYIIN